MKRTATSRSKSSRNGHANHGFYADLDKIRSAFADTGSDLKDKTSELVSHSIEGIRHKSDQLQHNVADYASERPFKSLGVAFLIGMGLGYFLRRKK